MLLSDKHRVLFIHNPKAGGSAIRTALSPLAEQPSMFWHQGYLEAEDRVVDLAHLELSELPNFGVDYRNYSILFVSRDPIERFLSGVDEHIRQHERVIEDLNEFISREMTVGNLYYDWKYVHLRPQYRFLRVGKGVNLPANLVVLRHSELAVAWPLVSQKLRAVRAQQECLLSEIPEWTPPQLLQIRARPDSEKRFSRETLSEASLAKLVRTYYLDYCLFGYQMPSGVLSSDGCHASNIEMIHRPYLRASVQPEALRPGELKAYHQFS